MAANFLGLAKSYAALKKVPLALTTAVAPQLSGLLSAGFAGGTDPYGQAWAALAPRTLERHGPPPLTDSGALAGSARLIPFPSGMKLGSTPSYGSFHMSGTGRMPKRRWFPDAGLPATWRAVIQAELTRQVHATVKR